METHDPHAPYRPKRNFTRTMPRAWRGATAALGPRAFTVGTAPRVRLKRADVGRLRGGAAAAKAAVGPRMASAMVGTAAWTIPTRHAHGFPAEGSHLKRYS
jgi:hypothetical protein